MAALPRWLPFLLLVAIASLRAAPPAGLATALEYLRDQRSYSWEMINSDPGPVAQEVETRRGKFTTVQQNFTPNLKGKLARNGDMLIEREWADGLRLTTIVAADGHMVTLTPEGWMSDREILTAQAEERLGNRPPSARALWLRRADRPDVRRPDQELVPFLKSNLPVEFNGDSYVIKVRSRNGDPSQPNENDSEPAVDVVVTMNVRNGMIRDYEVKVAATRRITRARLPISVSDQRIAVITYLPVSRIDIPAEAEAKLQAARGSGAGRAAP